MIKQSTAITFLLGPILDADGVAKTDEVVASIKVTKNGSVGAPNGASTLTHNHTGHYLYAANAGDGDTLGEVRFSLNSGTNAMAPVSFQVVPANVYASMVAGSDKLQTDARELGGTSLTGRDIGASVLLSAGTGAGQLDFTSGIVKSNLTQILGTLLTETAGQIAAGFKKLFNVATPVLTAESVNQTIDNPTADAIGDDAASKILVTPAQKLKTDASGEVTAKNMRGTDDANMITPNTVIPDTAGTAATLHGTTDAAIATRSSHNAAAVITALFAKDGITAGGTATFQDIIKALYSTSRGKIVKTGDAYAFMDDDGTTTLFTLTIASGERSTA